MSASPRGGTIRDPGDDRVTRTDADGEPLKADFQGAAPLEYTWFALSDSMPGITISAERAARKIIDACRHGDPELTITLPAKLATRLNHRAPATVGRLARCVSIVATESAVAHNEL
jgi:hypothetical protein